MSTKKPRALFLMPPFSRHAGRREWTGIEGFYNPLGFFDRVVLASLDETERDLPNELGSLRIAPLHGLAPASHAQLLPGGLAARACPVTRALIALAREHEVDLLVQRYGGPLYHGVPIALAAAALGRPSIITLNSDYDAVRALRPAGPRGAWTNRLEERRWRILLSRVDWVWSVSDYIRHQVLQRGFPAERVVTIPNKESIERFSAEAPEVTRQEVLRQLGLDDLAGHRVVLSVGRLTPAKNYPRMIEAFAGLAADDASLQYVIVGRGPEEPTIREAIGSAGLEDRVRLVTDYLTSSQLAVLYREAELLLFCSLFEGQGRVPFEAMACGTPVVGSDVGPIPEMVREGETGALADPRDAASIAAAARRLLGSGVAAGLVDACRDMAARFDLARVEPLEVDLYGRSLARTRRT